MSVLGLSILIASVSFFCYRCPPSSWLVPQWLPIFPSKKPLHDAPSIQLRETPKGRGDELKSKLNEAVESQSIRKTQDAATIKQDLDRKAMPPPPPPFKKPLLPASAAPAIPKDTPDSPPTPRAPKFSISSDESEPKPSIPSFPAMNSAQRASGGIRGPAGPNLSAGGLMPPPQRKSLPLPNRGPPSSSSLAPPPTHTSIPTKPRRKVLLTPGHSPLDWARLTSSPQSNLSGLPPGTPYLKVPPSLLKQMTGRRGKDAWTVLGGKVYNITPYAPYHPGGEPELMKAAGRDGSRLFGEVHPWVNWEGMLEGCLVGVAVEEGDVARTGKLEEMD